MIFLNIRNTFNSSHCLNWTPTVASYNLQVGVFLLDVLDHVYLKNGVSLGRILLDTK